MKDAEEAMERMLAVYARLVSEAHAEAAEATRRAEAAELALTKWRAEALTDKPGWVQLRESWDQGVHHAQSLPREPAAPTWDVRFYRTCYAVSFICGGLLGTMAGAWFL